MKKLILFLILLLTPVLSFADLSPLEITEEDGNPSTFPYQVKFSNGSVTDNGDGTVSVSTSSGTISGTAPSLVFTDTTASEDDFELIVDGSVARYVNTTDGITTWIHYADNAVGLGEVGFAPSYVWIVTDGTGDNELRLPGDSVGVGELDIADEPANGESITYQASTGRMVWASGGSANSFETISVPAGTAPVADSSSDTLTITETSFLTITGTAASDTIDITQVTTDLGTDGLIAANAVALGTDTTNDYVATVADGTGIDGTTSGETATYTPTLDLTEINTATFGSGTFTALQFNSATDDYELDFTATGRIVNTTDGRTSLIDYGNGPVGLGEVGKAPTAIWLTTDGTGEEELVVPTGSIGTTEIGWSGIEFTRSIMVENLAAADDNLMICSWDRPVTIRGIWVSYVGTGTTPAIIALEDGAGNAMTHNAPVAVASSSNPLRVNVTANNTLLAREPLRFDVSNAVSPETDEYLLNIVFTYDA